MSMKNNDGQGRYILYNSTFIHNFYTDVGKQQIVCSRPVSLLMVTMDTIRQPNHPSMTTGSTPYLAIRSCLKAGQGNNIKIVTMPYHASFSDPAPQGKARYSNVAI